VGTTCCRSGCPRVGWDGQQRLWLAGVKLHKGRIRRLGNAYWDRGREMARHRMALAREGPLGTSATATTFRLLARAQHSSTIPPSTEEHTESHRPHLVHSCQSYALGTPLSARLYSPLVDALGALRGEGHIVISKPGASQSFDSTLLYLISSFSVTKILTATDHATSRL
jgi:hypothetical protein